MIVPMRKLSLLLYHKEKETFLTSLQDLGVVHVVVNPEASSEALMEKQMVIKDAERVLRALKHHAAAEKVSLPQAKDLSAQQVISRFEELGNERDTIESRIQTTRKHIAALEPWGDFDPDSIGRLAQRDIVLRLYECNKKKFEEIQNNISSMEIISRLGNTVYFLVVGRGELEPVDADEVLLPSISLTDAKKQLENLEQKKNKVYDSFTKLTAYTDILSSFLAEQQCGRALEAARISMEGSVEGRVVSLSGWVPHDNEKKVAEFLNGFPAWYTFEKPSPDDTIPVKLINGKFSSLFEPIAKMRSLPDYFELDPTPFFAPFFALFFGLCFADVGYGAILAILGIVASRKVPAKFKRYTTLVTLLGIFTIICGTFLNTFFGHPIFSVPGYENAFFESGAFLAPLSAVKTESGTYFPAIPLSLYVGILQLLVGMGMRAYNRAHYGTILHALDPVATMTMTIGVTIFLVKINFMELQTFSLWAFPLGQMIASLPGNIEWIIAGSGLAFLLFFNNPEKGLAIRLPLGIYSLYNFATGLMGDGLSYLRLFALGLAGGLLGAAFNQIAFMLVTKDGAVQLVSPMIIFTILILVAGHGINFVLALIGCFVHPLRLTFVEFYKNVDFKGGAPEYSPLTNLQ
ncbi:MAG: hypothetical protein GF350_03490 [Chitinivibrionales bacterium]|nr:hypothetical protein [Chitinivibrionales bacterium]